MKKILTIVFALFSGSCAAQQTQTFSAYFNGLPAAATPISSSLPMIVLQGGLAKQTSASAVITGLPNGGTPLVMQSHAPVGPPGTTFEIIPAVANTDGHASFVVQSIRNFSGDGVPFNFTGYFATQVNFSHANAWAGGLVSELNVTSNTWNGVTGNRPFAEALDTTCRIGYGITVTTTCEAAVVGSVANSPYGVIVGVEAGVSQTVNVIPDPSTFNPATMPNAAAFIANINDNGSGTPVANAGYEIGPYSSVPSFQVGYWCPQEQTAGDEITTSCFESDAHSKYGINLAGGTYSIASINAPGFQITPTGDVRIGNVASQFVTLTFNSGAGLLINWPFIPNADNALTLGVATLRWSGIYSMGYFAGASNLAGVSTVCTVTAGNSYTFTLGLLTSKGANCT